MKGKVSWHLSAPTPPRTPRPIRGSRASSTRGRAVKVTASFGIATYPEDAGDLAALLHEADSRLYRSKGAGKNTITSD